MITADQAGDGVDRDLYQAASLARGLTAWLERLASPTVEAILGEIREHFLETGYTVEKLKETLGLKDNFFIAAFSAEVFGFTVRGFIQLCRLLTAACLLRDTSRRVLDIALDVGYDGTEANFSFLFHEWCGLYPTPFRELARDLRRRIGHAPEEVLTWGCWRRLHSREYSTPERLR